MSDTNNRPPIQRGLKDIREGGGDLPDRGVSTGELASYPNDSSIEDTGFMGKMSGTGSDAPSPGKDMPKPADQFSGGSHDGSMGSMGGLGNTGSDGKEAA